MLFVPYALHDRDAYARTAREKFESLGKGGQRRAPRLRGRSRGNAAGALGQRGLSVPAGTPAGTGTGPGTPLGEQLCIGPFCWGPQWVVLQAAVGRDLAVRASGRVGSGSESSTGRR